MIPETPDRLPGACQEGERKSSGSRRHLSRTLPEAPQIPLTRSKSSSHILPFNVPQRPSQSLSISLHPLCRNGPRGMPAAKMDGFLCMIPETPGRLPGACQEVYGEIVVFTQAPLQNAPRGSSGIAHPLHWSHTSHRSTCLRGLLRRLPKRPSEASQSPLHIPLIRCAATVPHVWPTGWFRECQASCLWRAQGGERECVWVLVAAPSGVGECP